MLKLLDYFMKYLYHITLIMCDNFSEINPDYFEDDPCFCLRNSHIYYDLNHIGGILYDDSDVLNHSNSILMMFQGRDDDSDISREDWQQCLEQAYTCLGQAWPTQAYSQTQGKHA